MIVTHEILARMFGEAKKQHGLEKWGEIALEFVHRQDQALKDCRDGYRTLLAETATLRDDQKRLNYIEEKLRRDNSEMHTESGLVIRPKHTWAVAGEFSLRETIDILMAQEVKKS